MLNSFLEFLQQSSLSGLIAGSRYGAMAIQTVHVLGFTLLLAVVVAFNLRAHNVALRSLSLRRMTASLRRYYAAALTAALLAGFLLGMPRAVAYWGNIAFVYKLALLLPVVVLQFLLQQRALALPEGAEASAPLRLSAALALVLWFAVGAAGRAIGFVA